MNSKNPQNAGTLCVLRSDRVLLTYVTIVKYMALKLELICSCVTQLSFQAVFGLGCCFDCSCGDMTEGKNRYFLDKLIKEEK